MCDEVQVGRRVDCCHLFNDIIMCAIEVLIAGKFVAFDFCDSGVYVVLVDCDPYGRALGFLGGSH